jgi:hypothetical protein
VTGRLAAALAAVALLAGCAGSASSNGEATIWLTRDRGRQVLLVRTVPAGLTAMQGLDRVADIETSYGGRYVQSIEGISGSAGGRRDWFYFVNGVEGDRGAAEYRLHAGDVEWWDYRSWARAPRVPLVVGAFPEPFVHGYGGSSHPTAVRYEPPSARAAARRIGRLIHADSIAPASRPVSRGWSTFRIVRTRLAFRASGEAHGPWHFEIDAAGAERLAGHPRLARYRFRGLP